MASEPTLTERPFTDHPNDEIAFPTTPSSEFSTSSTDEATTAPIDDGCTDHGEGEKVSPSESDAGPFNVVNYQRRLPQGVTDRTYKYSSCKTLETLSAVDSIEYNIHEGTKLAVIFNNETFRPDLALDKRNGTKKDCEAIQLTFSKLGFEVEIFTDANFHEIRTTLSLIQNRSNLSCLVLFILTHGEEDGKLFSYDGPYNLNRDVITELLPEQAANLAGKPKMIFIQACQGKFVDDGTKLRLAENQSRSRHTSTDGISHSSTYCIPNYSDFLICQASYHGFYSFRSSTGSWLIQTLCEEINLSSSTDEVLAIMTRVLRRVATQKVSNVPHEPSLHNKKQIPLVQFTLMRSVYLKKEKKLEETRLSSLSKGKSSGRSPSNRVRAEVPRKSSSSQSRCFLS